MTLNSEVERPLDAILVVPGIMGSELIDADGSQLWGLCPGDLLKAYQGSLLDRLVVTDADLDGTRGVRATQLLHYPGILKWFRGSDDYDALITVLSGWSPDRRRDSRAVRAFPYDWRLSVQCHVDSFLSTAAEHLAAWRKVVDAERLADSTEVGLTIVAHSMGGLIARAASLRGLGELGRVTVVTLGTPYYGSVNAVRLLAEGRGSPLPGLDRERLQVFARSSPGLHDLLPRYRCITQAPRECASNTTGRRTLSVDDLTSLGVASNLARDAEDRWKALDLPGQFAADLEWHVLAGIQQPTIETFALTDGQATFAHPVPGGDGTVHRQSAGPGWHGTSAAVHAQSHTGLVASGDSLAYIHDKLLHRDSPPPLGTSRLSLAVPDAALAGQGVTVAVARFVEDDNTWVPALSEQLVVTSKDLETKAIRRWGPPIPGREGWAFASHPGLPPGIHQIHLTGGAGSPVSELLWVDSP